uniref:transposase n=1 Tax=Nitratireductor aquimarinus TaxID=889300 RepID=UPI0036F28EDC
MPKHVLMSDDEIITDGGRRRRWTSSEKLRIVEETLEENASISVVARRNEVVPLFRTVLTFGAYVNWPLFRPDTRA